MITVRQIQRLWTCKAYERLLDQLITPRPEASNELIRQLTGSGGGMVPAAAMVVIRLDELAQSYVPLGSELIRTILSAQRPDGGFGDVMVNALCLRALMCCKGHGEAIERGLSFLAALQKPEGIWPSMPVWRMPTDAFASAFILIQLGDIEQFRYAVRFNEAVEWFSSNEFALDEDTRKLWMRTRRRVVLAHKPGIVASSVGSAAQNFWKPSPALSA